jgi:hypothetical protein
MRRIASDIVFITYSPSSNTARAHLTVGQFMHVEKAFAEAKGSATGT